VCRSPEEILSDLTGLCSGDSVTYYTGRTGWISAPEMKEVFDWVNKAVMSGTHDFTQKSTGNGVFEYIARRRIEPCQAKGPRDYQ